MVARGEINVDRAAGCFQLVLDFISNRVLNDHDLVGVKGQVRFVEHERKRMAEPLHMFPDGRSRDAPHERRSAVRILGVLPVEGVRADAKFNLLRILGSVQMVRQIIEEEEQRG